LYVVCGIETCWTNVGIGTDAGDCAKVGEVSAVAAASRAARLK
jgi:hypothetical protein